MMKEWWLLSTKQGDEIVPTSLHRKFENAQEELFRIQGKGPALMHLFSRFFAPIETDQTYFVSLCLLDHETSTFATSQHVVPYTDMKQAISTLNMIEDVERKKGCPVERKAENVLHFSYPAPPGIRCYIVFAELLARE